MGKRAALNLISLFFTLIAFLISAVTIAGAFASYTDPNDHPLMGYIAFGLPVLLLANGVLFLYWLIRKKKQAVVPLVALLANTGYFTAVFHYSLPSGQDMETLTVATYNIHSFNKEKTGFTAKQIALYMEKVKADVLCFQEFNGNIYFPLDSLSRVFDRYPYRYIPVLPNRHTRIAVFSRYPLTDSLFVSFPGTDNCGLYVDMLVREKIIRLFNVHMQTTDISRAERQLERNEVYFDREDKIKAFGNIRNTLLENMQERASQANTIHALIDKSPYPVLVCGDFNDTPASYTYRTLKNNLDDGFQSCGKGYQYTFRGLFRLLRIDYIFHSPEIKAVRYVSPSLKWSDHNPVIMEIEIP